MSPEPPDTITHPVLGELRWEIQRECWFTQVHDQTGGWLDVAVLPEDVSNRLTGLDQAADLYTRAMREERRLLRAAVRDQLLELYHDAWADSGEQFTGQQLLDQLHFEYIRLSPGGLVAVTLSYNAGDLFGGHAVDVELGSDLQILDVNLVG